MVGVSVATCGVVFEVGSVLSRRASDVESPEADSPKAGDAS